MEVSALGVRVDGIDGIKSLSTSLRDLASHAKGLDGKINKPLDGIDRLAARAAKEMKHLADQARRLSDYDIRNNDIQAYGAELDRLRAKYNPLYAASKQYERELEELNRAQRVGAINSVEYANALNTLNSRFAQGSQMAGRSRTNYDRLGGSMSGLAAQFQDIGVTAAMGMNPLIVGLQQGTQIAGQMEAAMMNGASATKVFTSAFKSLAAPVSILSVGLTVVATALIQVVDWTSVANTALNALAGAIEFIAPAAALAGGALAVFYAPALIAGIGTLTTLIGTGLVAALKAVTAWSLANPFGAVMIAIAGLSVAIYKFNDTIADVFGVDIVGAVKGAANYLVNSFYAAFEDIKFIWNNFGSIVGNAVISGVNIAIRSINKLITGTAQSVNGLISLLKENVPGFGDISLIGDLNLFNEIENPFEQAFNSAVTERNKRIAEIMGRDTIGAYVKGAKKAASGVGDFIRGLATFGGEEDEKTKKTGRTKNPFNDDYVAQLQERIALIGKETEYEQLLEKIRLGSIKFSTKELENQALSYAKVIDQINAQTEAYEAQKKVNEEALKIADDLRTEEEKLIDSYNKRRDIILSSTIATAEERKNILTRLEQETSDKLTEINGSFWEKYLISAQQSMTSFDDLSKTVVENFTTQVGGAFESMVFDSENFGDAMRGVAQSLVRSVVNALGQMAAQWLAYQAVQLLVGRTTQASGAAALAANASASSLQAGLSAYASTAAIPIVGPALAPAAMAAAISTTAPIAAAVGTTALAGMAHDGIDSIPKDGTWLLQKGERVTTAQTSAKLDATLSRVLSNQREDSMTQRPPAVVNLIESRSRAGQVETSTGLSNEEVINIFVADIRGGGRSAQAMENTYGMQRVGR